MAHLHQTQVQVIINGLDQSYGLVAKMITLSFSLSQAVTYASAIFARVHAPNVFLYNTMIKAYSKSSTPLAAVRCYRLFCVGLRPDHYTFPPLLEACKEASDLDVGLQIHSHIIRTGLESNVFTQTQLLRFLAECGSVAHARRVFDEMGCRDGVAWTTMIASYASECGDINEAFRLFQEMPFQRDGFCWNVIIAGFIRWDNIVAARKLFDEFPQKDVVSWTEMISAYAQKGHYREALHLFDQMRVLGCKPNHLTLVSLLSSCAHLGSIRVGMSIHQFIEKNGIFIDVYIGTTLIDMYSKCGDIENSLKIFNLMPRKDVYTWNTMIEGLASHGQGRHALDLFMRMEMEGLEPNGVTFVGVLTACSHVGLVKVGRAYFHLMINEYGITPRIEHYGCLVDLLGRAGLVDEAEEVVNRMPIQPNAVVWGALLAACKVGGNVELGERALKHLLELEPENGGNYTLLSNIYAAASRWDDVDRMRKMMRNPTVEKIRGFSCIEVGGLVYEFSQGDDTQSKCVYELLEEIAMRLKDMGHVPQTGEVLHDIDEEEKENALSWHSEKLAIAFGLIHTCPGSSLMIMKNLRMCRDCHSTTKLVSRIFSRKITVRDRVRFHHFTDGECSCYDFW
ncbi:pentatricopeptide repeat-containing protein At1g08070, chloroplastic-like [Magnolia sinica]|uniref:pentatricopeptide repeat-containing protein At1g08070, chloroplastic-like n=1 Tax=Magnolia sinica TaxID=86752 RepID=UPI002657C779|nr:pentatricopeptide repeat-containing protein At1g08070, chloroplastic-like [Magnolia sinica]